MRPDEGDASRGSSAATIGRAERRGIAHPLCIRFAYTVPECPLVSPWRRKVLAGLIADRLERPFKRQWAPLAPSTIAFSFGIRSKVGLRDDPLNFAG